ncbi:MAG TPA: hypothetical protein VHN99_08370, partial [Deinococcales bacterium]|nr:hypothetical protein [Deinococcales bacterium]
MIVPVGVETGVRRVPAVTLALAAVCLVVTLGLPMVRPGAPARDPLRAVAYFQAHPYLKPPFGQVGELSGLVAGAGTLGPPEGLSARDL